MAIIDEILGGVSDRGAVVVEPDRAAAIDLALAGAAPGDIVVVAGKGHETTQVLAGREVPFDDRAVATELLVELGLVRDASAGGQDGPA
jgi:UDP-N-acetylmuramoyl-L-alanyl-D-glutamate--2,6-diaminopimelate ligase